MRLRDRIDASDEVARLAEEYAALQRHAVGIRTTEEIGPWNGQLASIVERALAFGLGLDDLTHS